MRAKLTNWVQNARQFLIPTPIITETFLVQKSIAPLITFRVLFGALMAFGGIRFWYNGWIERLYIEPNYFFKFYGFEWVTLPNETGIYVLFTLMILGAIGIMLGALYRLSAMSFFLSFTYIELLDVSNYLNHYYLVCLLAFWLLFLPANRAFSVDVLLANQLANNTFFSKFLPIPARTVPAWTINVLIGQLTIVYFFAGIAKLNYDWLFNAMPMAIWLPERANFPILGYFFQYKETAYLFSWFGAVYDLTIAFFLLYQPTRKWAYLAVIAFHIMTYLLFNIGLFPFIMMTSTLLFFSGEWHEKLLKFFGWSPSSSFNEERRSKVFALSANSPLRRLGGIAIALFFALQLFLPLRHHLYPSNVLWSEEGYRFSWRVMLVEKFGQATFYIQDGETNRRSEIINGQYLTQFQEKQMCIQPDLILQFAHIIRDKYMQEYGFKNPIVTVESYVALNGRISQQLIDPKVNLAEINDSFAPKNWILPFQE